MTRNTWNRGRSIQWRRHLEGYLFMGPWLAGFLVFTAGAMSSSALIALTTWDLINPPKFVLFDNFVRMWNDERFWIALYNTAFYTFIGVPLHLIAALLVALALSIQLPGMSLFRTAFYIPTVTPAVASALLWMYIFNSDFGVANMVLEVFTIPPVKWLADPQAAKPALIIMGFWHIGGAMVIFLAGLQSVPETLYEAASMDGAGALRRALYVTLPMISPVIFFNLVLGIIGSFQVFTSAFIMTGGGPRDATYFLVLMIYGHAFSYFRMGYASAIAWVLFVIVLIFTIVQFKLANRWVYYEGGLRE